jgi:transcriptional regulator with XRE-family HTH domain
LSGNRRVDNVIRLRKQARKDKGLTQKEVALKMKMTQQQYSRFENGVFELNYSQIIELCALYDITPNDLFCID